MGDKTLRNIIISFMISAALLWHVGPQKIVEVAKTAVEAITPDVESKYDDRTLKIGGQAFTLPVGRDGIHILISQNFTKEQQEAIIEAIKELDEHMLHVKYNIYTDASKAPKNCITLEEVDPIKNIVTTGITESTHIPFVPYLLCPIEVCIDADMSMHKYTGLQKDRFKCMVKHELLHVLGLKDLRDKKYETETIMYYTQTKNSPRDLTQSDIDMLNDIYDEEYVNRPYFNYKFDIKNDVKNFIKDAIQSKTSKNHTEEDELTM